MEFMASHGILEVQLAQVNPLLYLFYGIGVSDSCVFFAPPRSAGVTGGHPTEEIPMMGGAAGRWQTVVEAANDASPAYEKAVFSVGNPGFVGTGVPPMKSGGFGTLVDQR